MFCLIKRGDVPYYLVATGYPPTKTNYTACRGDKRGDWFRVRTGSNCFAYFFAVKTFIGITNVNANKKDTETCMPFRFSTKAGP